MSNIPRLTEVFKIREGLFGMGGPPERLTKYSVEQLANSDEKWLLQQKNTALKNSGKPAWKGIIDKIEQAQEYRRVHGWQGENDDKQAQDTAQKQSAPSQSTSASSSPSTPSSGYQPGKEDDDHVWRGGDMRHSKVGSGASGPDLSKQPHPSDEGDYEWRNGDLRHKRTGNSSGPNLGPQRTNNGDDSIRNAF